MPEAGDLIVHIASGRYYNLISILMDGKTWVCEPCDMRMPCIQDFKRFTENEFQVLTMPKEPWVAIYGASKSLIFKGYQTNLDAMANAENDLGLRPGDTYFICRVVPGHDNRGTGMMYEPKNWQCKDIQFYIASDSVDHGLDAVQMLPESEFE